MLIHRIKDFVSDNRFPWIIRPKIDNSLISQNAFPQKKYIYMVLTFDIEQDGGSEGTASVKLAQLFLENIKKNLGNRKATLFVQGDIIAQLSKNLQKAAKDYELGLHSYHHNALWGDPVWFLTEKSLTISEKKQNLKDGLAAFTAYNLPKPISFRAPNMVINKESLMLLEEFGFIADSSFPSYRAYAKPKKYKDIWEFPVSNLAEPRTVWHKGIPIRDFAVFNMGNLKQLPTNIWKENITTMVKQQKNAFLVFLAHSWDFDKMKFDQMVTYLEKNWEIKYLSLSELIKLYE